MLDKNWWCKESNTPKKGRVIEDQFSRYITMKDGVKIALEIYLPEKVYYKEKFPCILLQTRYYREFDFRFPFNLFLKQPNEKMIKEFIRNGYAWITADVRGSGASTGYRKSEWSKKELGDAVEILDWITKQSWCDGNIGAAGVSYDGACAEFLASQNHKSLKAVAPIFSVYDLYSDIAYPGGIHFEWFTRNWGKANRALDAMDLSIAFGILGKLAVKGVKPIKGYEKILDNAKRDHEKNWDVHKEASSIKLRDDVSKYNIKLDDFSPHNRTKQINRAKVPFYTISGWWDGAYANSSKKKFQALKYNTKKLTLGPWDHGGHWNVSPYRKTSKIHFDFNRELIRFFDRYLKNIKNGIEDEKKVHYYTMGNEVWKEADSFPPENILPTKFYLREGNQLHPIPPNERSASDVFINTNQNGTGERSRWNSLFNPFYKKSFYKHRKNDLKKSLVYRTQSFSEDKDLTGQAIVTIYLKVDAPDADIFVYLDETDELGRISYITEGCLRLSMSKVISRDRTTKVPIQSFLKKDLIHIDKNRIHRVEIALLPISYTIKKGHSLLLSLCNSDKDHFNSISENGLKMEVYRNHTHLSELIVPFEN